MDEFDMCNVPLLECLTAVASHAPTVVAPFAPDVYMRCLRSIENTMAANSAGDGRLVKNAAGFKPFKDFAILGMDLIGSLAEGLEEDFKGWNGYVCGIQVHMLILVIQGCWKRQTQL